MQIVGGTTSIPMALFNKNIVQLFYKRFYRLKYVKRIQSVLERDVNTCVLIALFYKNKHQQQEWHTVFCISKLRIFTHEEILSERSVGYI